MTHIRSQIRAAAKAALVGGTVPATSIFTGRAHPVDEKKLPAWRVFIPGEASQPLEIGSPREVGRVERLVLEGFAAGTEADDDLDALAVEAEVRLSADLTLGGLAKDIHLVSTEFTFSGEGRKTMGLMALSFDVTAHTLDTDPETAL